MSVPIPDRNDPPLRFLDADWPAPVSVRAGVTTRIGGVSPPPYAGLNLGSNTDDAPANVAENRVRLRAALGLPREPAWLRQVHGTRVVHAENPGEADAVWTDRPGQVCAVLTADCLPVLLCDDSGRRVAAAHAGWRGLAAGVLEAAIEALAVPPQRLMAWLGPAIGPDVYEVGAEVRAAFLQRDPGAHEAFAPTRENHWLANLYALAQRRLEAQGLERVYGGGFCTLRDEARFFSYRRDERTGRMASLIWREV